MTQDIKAYKIVHEYDHSPFEQDQLKKSGYFLEQIIPYKEEVVRFKYVYRLSGTQQSLEA